MTSQRIYVRGKARRAVKLVRGEVGTLEVTLVLNEKYLKAQAHTRDDVRSMLRKLGSSVVGIDTDGNAYISDSWLAQFVDIEDVRDRDWRYDNGEVSVIDTDYRRGPLEP